MNAITTVTRKIWRDVHTDVNTAMMRAHGPYFDILAIAPTIERRVAIYDMAYVAEPLTFEQIEAHTELGGLAVALRQDVVYAVFTEQDGPGFAELWPDVTYHMIVSIGEPEWEIRGGSSSPTRRS